MYTIPSTPNSLLALVDGMNLAYRSYFAYQNLRTKEGKKPTGVLFGFLRAVSDLLAITPHVVICWDGEGSWRKASRPSYKGNRQRDPNISKEVYQQVAWLSEALAALGLLEVRVATCEADDVLGVLSGIGTLMGKRKVLIVGNDKDYYQLLSEWVTILPKVGEHVIQQTTVEKRYGIPIDLWPDYLALGGDGSDNIHPLRGVGPKTALEWVRAGVYPSFANFNNLDPKVPQAVRDRCKKAWDNIHSCYQMALLPSACDDSRLPPHAQEGMAAALRSVTSYTRTIPDNGRMQLIRFLARFELMELLAIRNRFFRAA